MLFVNSFLLALLAHILVSCDALSVEDYGAIEGIDTWATAVNNAGAFAKAVSAANSSNVDRTVVFPAGKTYYLTNTTTDGVSNINIQVDGTVRFSNEIQRYPFEDTKTAFLLFTNCEGIHVAGSGTVDGQGLNWWRLCYKGIDNRPNLFEFQYSRDITFEDVLLLNSPRFSINFKDCADIVIHDLTIFIDSTLIRGENRSSVMYPLNTDGIDIAAFNVTIYNTNITNYDDAIVAKPCRSNWKYCTCAGNIYAYNNTITYSTGLTIGSVPPNADVNCVRNVTFRDTYMDRPLKGLYIKSNPGTSGTGIIEDILYENIFIHTALWWTVWIGPQQQNQPGGDSGTGCNFLFPFVPECPTQPLVSMKRITLRNVTAVNTIPLFESPGVVLCDPAAPCTDLLFDRVTNQMFTGNITDIIDKFPIPVPGVIFPTPYRPHNPYEYITANAYGALAAPVQPTVCLDPSCFWVAPQ